MAARSGQEKVGCSFLMVGCRNAGCGAGAVERAWWPSLFLLPLVLVDVGLHVGLFEPVVGNLLHAVVVGFTVGDGELVFAEFAEKTTVPRR